MMRLVSSFVLSAAIAAAASPVLFASSVHAQAVIASVNDDPVTNVDVEQHTKILRVLHRNATRDAALDSVIETRLKLMETSKYKVNPGDPDIGWALGISARANKMEPQQLLVALQRAGVSEDQWKQKWKAEAAWMMFVRALNRTLEVSENEVRGELARQGKARATEYTIRQVTLVVPNNASGATLQSRMSDAQQLRAKFTDCATGVELARATRDTAVNQPLSRSASALSEPLRKVLDATPIGHLTQPNRGATGIEMLALCGKVDREDANAADTIRSDLVMKRLETEFARRYQEIRAKAVIVKK